MSRPTPPAPVPPHLRGGGSCPAESNSPSVLKSIINADLYRYRGCTGRKAFWKTWVTDRSFRFLYSFRCYSYFVDKRGFFNRFRSLCYRVLYEYYRQKYGFEISYRARIGKGLYLGHHGDVAINGGAIIGTNVNIAQGVTIGIANRGKRKGSPTIGSNVWIGANAVIVGKVTIGDNALIGPLAYVNFDVPENAVVVAERAKIISYDGTAGYVERRVLEDDPAEASG